MTAASGLAPSMEQLWGLTALLRNIAQFSVYSLLCARFLSVFLPGRRLPAYFAAAAYAAVLFICLVIPINMLGITVYAAASVSACLLYILPHRSRTLLKLYACLVFDAIQCVASTVGSAAYIGLCAQFVWPLHADPEAQFHMFIAACAGDVAACAATAVFSLRLIARTFPDPHGSLLPGEFGLLSAPAAVAIVTSVVLHELRQILDYGRYSFEVEMLALVLGLVVLVSLIATVLMFARIRAEQEDRTNRQLLGAQLQSMREYIALMEQNDNRMARLRHDAAGHLETIAALQARGDLTAADAYASRTYSELTDAQSLVHSGNPVTDVIIDEQRRKAEQHNIRYTADFQFPRGLGIDAFDIGVLLHNAGRNAIEAASITEAGWICLRSVTHRRTFMLEMENSCHCPVPLNPITGLPETSKTGEHGIGLRNIRSIAAKYGGSVQVKARNDTFVLTVLLCSPPTHS